MKIVVVQIKSNEALFVVLFRKSDGEIFQTNECSRFSVKDHTNSEQIKQFRVQVNTAMDMINPDRIIVMARNANAKGRMTPSPISFKLEGIIQLYDKMVIEFVWPQTVSAWLKKNDVPLIAENKYQQEALNAGSMILLN